MSGSRATIVKFGAFALVMVLLTGFLYLIFGQYRTGSTNSYTAVFDDASRLMEGDSVRVSGIRVGTVSGVELRSDRKVLVTFDADRSVALTDGTQVAVRYLNLVGDRYLELVNQPGPTDVLPPGSEIPSERTLPALDLDLLLGGLKPVIRGLNAEDVNALSASLLQVFQGQGSSLQSLLSRTSSFTNTLADHSQIIESLIENLNLVVATLADNGAQFGESIDKLSQLISELSVERDPIGQAIDSLASGTASLADLLGDGRQPLANLIDELNRVAPLLDDGKSRLDASLQKAPENYRKLQRLGSYGSFIMYYICGVTVRVTDLQGRTAVFPWIKQTNGRCS